MKSKLVAVLLLGMMFSLFTGASLFSAPTSSGVILSSSMSDTQNQGTSLNINGNLTIMGNNVTRFIGISSKAPLIINLNGTINVTGNATLVLQHVTLFFLGARTAYDRYIQLTNATDGHPRLIMTDTVIVSKTTRPFTVKPAFGRPFNVTASVGGAIKSNDGEIIGSGILFYRDVVLKDRFSTGGPTLIQALGTTNATFSNLQVDRVQSFGTANVSVIIGGGPNRINTKVASADTGVGFDAFNSSKIFLYRVSMMNVTTSGNAYMSLSSSAQVPSFGYIFAKDFSRIDILSQSEISSGVAGSSAGGLATAGNASVFVSGSIAKSGVKLLPILTARDNSTVVFGDNCTVVGKISTFDYSRVIVNNPASFIALNSLKDLFFIEHDFSIVNFTGSWLWLGGKTNEIQLYDNSRFYASGSRFDYLWVQAHNSSSLIFSNSKVNAAEFVIEDNVNMKLLQGSSVVHVLEMRDDSSLFVDSSSVEMVYGLGNSKISVINGNITSFNAKDASILSSVDSTINELHITSSNAVGSVTGLTHFYQSQLLTFPGTSVIVNVTSTTVKDLDFLFLGNSQVSIFNSSITALGLQGNSLINVTNLTNPLDSLALTGNAKAFFYLPFRVRSVDYFGNPLAGSAITLTSGFSGTGKVLSRAVTGADGWATFMLFSGFANATGKFPYGDITILDSYGGVSQMQPYSLGFVNNDAVISLPLPGWSGYILPVVIVVAVVVVIALLSFAYGRLRRTS